jgi:hypothetical protein
VRGWSLLEKNLSKAFKEMTVTGGNGEVGSDPRSLEQRKTKDREKRMS